MPRVGCRVEGCSHWRVGDRCGAEAIDVLSEEVPVGREAAGTMCATFTPRDLLRFYLRGTDAYLLGALFTAEGEPEVVCTVTTCAHWGAGNVCQAEAILIAGASAHIAEDADCTTFEAREPREVPRPAE